MTPLTWGDSQSLTSTLNPFRTKHHTNSIQTFFFFLLTFCQFLFKVMLRNKTFLEKRGSLDWVLQAEPKQVAKASAESPMPSATLFSSLRNQKIWWHFWRISLSLSFYLGLKRGVCSQINHFPEDADYDQDAAEYLLRESGVFICACFWNIRWYLHSEYRGMGKTMNLKHTFLPFFANLLFSFFSSQV